MLIALTKGYFAIVDEADAVIVGSNRWYVSLHRKSRTPYAMRSHRDEAGRKTRISLHRFLWTIVWKLPDAPQLDHVNLDGLDCRRSNLRAASFSQNQANKLRQSNNTSGFKGVSLGSKPDRRGPWVANISTNGKQTELGRFPSKQDAAEAYALAALKRDGDYVRRLTPEQLGALIDLVKTTLFNPVLADDPLMVEEAEQAATEIVGEITSRYLVVPLPTADEDAVARVELDELLPGLFAKLGASS